jgi:uncharacterized protein YjbJ (UPF0337 family)
MDSSTKDQTEGKWDQMKGTVKEKVGGATGDADMHNEGTADKAGGKVQEKIGDVKQVFDK